jgi:hypothetical protein
MNMPRTPLVQKLILLMLVLIFGCLVLLLINGRKQIEALRTGPNIELSTNGSNSDAAIRQAFPKMRSSRSHASTNPEEAPVKAAEPVRSPAPLPTDAPAVAIQPIVVPAPSVIELPKTTAEAHGVFGRVMLLGTPPAETVIQFDPTCGAMHSNAVTTQRYVIDHDGGLANVLVYVSKGLETKQFNPPPPVLLDQKNCLYQPTVIGAMVNQTIQIKNSDPVLHNVHAMPRVSGNEEFNFAQPLQDQTDERKFARPEIFVRIKCEVHDWMLAYVGVVKNPYFVVTDTNGLFQLPDGLPPGRYEITATHLKAGSISKTITLKRNPVRLIFTLSVNGQGTLASERH